MGTGPPVALSPVTSFVKKNFLPSATNVVVAAFRVKVKPVLLYKVTEPVALAPSDLVPVELKLSVVEISWFTTIAGIVRVALLAAVAFLSTAISKSRAIGSDRAKTLTVAWGKNIAKANIATTTKTNPAIKYRLA